MANLKNINDLPVAESAEGLNLIVNDNGAAKQISAKSVGASSWNDLKNKPFGDGEEVVILERATYDGFFNPEANFNVLENSFQLDVVIGDIVNVFWDDEVYSCQVESFDGLGIYFGNTSYYGSEAENGLPFTFDWTEEHGWVAAAYGDLSVTSHTFGVTKVNVRKIDPKYLPEYDLVITYHKPLSLEFDSNYLEPISTSVLKNVCQKLKNRQHTRVLFRNKFNLSGWNPNVYIECPMTVKWNPDEEYVAVHALVVDDDNEGTLIRIVSAGFNENEFLHMSFEVM